MTMTTLSGRAAINVLTTAETRSAYPIIFQAYFPYEIPESFPGHLYVRFRQLNRDGTTLHTGGNYVNIETAWAMVDMLIKAITAAEDAAKEQG